ncbi:hypothetical protein OS493_014024 [Desmophyllum pertusum]|uniref:Proline-rich transmembrane protein 3/4 domain-containing protein n=1 Tax=Desmophyllum pertusum TaxID=174260 RepID=A0A9W9ZFE6_9CNID|nr:hypothetical protein OS493_014024 [Desmophyllum pertusum]
MGKDDENVEDKDAEGETVQGGNKEESSEDKEHTDKEPWVTLTEEEVASARSEVDKDFDDTNDTRGNRSFTSYGSRFQSDGSECNGNGEHKRYQPSVGTGRKRELLNSEPIPDWEEAKAEFKWAWGLHWILFVVLFLGLALYSIVRLIAASKRRQLREKVSRNVSYAVHSLVIVLGITRALALVLFPYEVTTNVNNADIVIPLYVHRIVFGLGFPCFMAAFALIQITFTASVKTAPLTYSKLRRIRFLVLVIVGHFSVVIIADVITALVESTSALYMVCTAYLLSMTLFTGIRITKSGYKVIRENNAHKKTMENYAPAPHTTPRADSNERHLTQELCGRFSSSPR